MPKVLLLFLLSQSVQAATPLEEAMSEDERIASGLHKLTEDEKAFLSNWLLARDSLSPIPEERELGEGVAATKIHLTVVSETDAFGIEHIDPPPIQMIKARLRGKFDGWDGDTKFRLNNGQVWQQRAGGTYNTADRSQPDIVIEKSIKLFIEMRQSRFFTDAVILIQSNQFDLIEAVPFFVDNSFKVLKCL